MTTLQFSCRSDIGSQLITWFSHGDLTHVDAVSGDGKLLGARKDVMKGVPAGVQIRPADYAKFTRIVRVELPTTPEQDAAFWKFLRAQLGKPYDEDAIMSFALNRNWQARDSWICSELIAAGLIACGYLRPLYQGVFKVAPMDLIMVLTALPLVKWRNVL